MRKLILVLASLCVVSCNNDDKGMNSAVYSVRFNMRVLNAEGEDILNPEHPDAIDTDQIKLYYVINGTAVEVYDPAMDSPRNFGVDEDPNDGFYKISIIANHTATVTETYIDWNETDRDTIICTIEFHDNATFLRKVWYNGEYKLDTAANMGLTFDVVK